MEAEFEVTTDAVDGVAGAGDPPLKKSCRLSFPTTGGEIAAGVGAKLAAPGAAETATAGSS